MADPWRAFNGTIDLAEFFKNKPRFLAKLSQVMENYEILWSHIYAACFLATKDGKLAQTYTKIPEGVDSNLGINYPLLHALYNLKRNASKYSQTYPKSYTKFVEPRITVKVDTDSGNIIYSVESFGQDLDEKTIPQLFGSYTSEGTGIGLQLVRRLAELHGGFASVEQNVDRGTLYFDTRMYKTAKEKTGIIDSQELKPIKTDYSVFGTYTTRFSIHVPFDTKLVDEKEIFVPVIRKAA